MRSIFMPSYLGSVSDKETYTFINYVYTRKISCSWKDRREKEVAIRIEVFRIMGMILGKID